MFLEEAHAAAADSGLDSAASSIGFGSLWVFVFIFIIMYFLMIRPQMQQQKKRDAMLKAIKRGDDVITAGGIIAKVKKVNEQSDEVVVEIAENVEVKLQRSTISEVILPNKEASTARSTKKVPKDKIKK